LKEIQTKFRKALSSGRSRNKRIVKLCHCLLVKLSNLMT